jgi:hypothetical protein
MAARLPGYSANNQLLIFDAMPEATQVEDFDYWKKQGTSVRGSEKSHITVLKAGGEYQKADGTTGINYELNKVFDISQTSAKPQVQIQHSLDDLIGALVHGKNITIEIVDSLPEQRIALYDKASNSIKLADNTDPEMVFKSLARELALASFAYNDPAYSREDHIIAATLATYTLCERYGVDNAGIDFNKLAPMLSEIATAQEARVFLGQVRDGASELSSNMAKALEKDGTEKPTPTPESTPVVAAPVQQRSDRDAR